jgi:hypothetical protein
MNKTNGIIIALVILGVLGYGLFFLNQIRLAEKEAIMEEQLAEHDQQQALLLQAQLEMQAQRESAAEQARHAEAARRMAEQQAEKERLEKNQLVRQLNERLKREAQDRRRAETAQRDLAEKMQQLEMAQAEAEAALNALEAASEEEAVVEDEAVALKEKIESQAEALAALEQENRSLKEQQQVLEHRQIATEEAIIKAGGKIDIPYPEIRSPNIRRKQAIYFKERILGHPGGS